MWNELTDVESANNVNQDSTKKGLKYYLKKSKYFIYALLGIIIIYIIFILYYRAKRDNDIKCDLLDEECKSFNYPEFNLNKLDIIDTNIKNNNFILRSNTPIHSRKFSEEELLKGIKYVIEKSNLTLTGEYTLNIISLLKNDEEEGCIYKSEVCFAKQAKIEHQKISGSDINPLDLNEKDLEKSLRSLSWNTDDILNKINRLNKNFNDLKNSIFLIHSTNGVNRTGEYVAAYKMIIKRYSLAYVVRDNANIGISELPYNNMNKWICLYLLKVLEYHNLKCSNI